MLIRGHHYKTLNGLLNGNDIDLESLNDEEQKIVISECYSKVYQFKDCIEKLITDYECLLNDADLDKHETTLFNTCREIENQLGHFNDEINTSIQRLLIENMHIQYIVKASSDYVFDLGKINDVALNIQNAQKILLDSKKQLNKIINKDNFGLKKIENGLSFFINLILNNPFIKSLDKNRSEIYSDILISLAEFYYNHGKNLFVLDKQNEEMTHINQRMPDNHIAISLILFMMAGREKPNVLENACYIHLLDKALNVKLDKNMWINHFDLRVFSTKSPNEFIQLYDYLFIENKFFSDYFNANMNENIYLAFKAGLLNLYLLFATKQLVSESINNVSKINHGINVVNLNNLTKRLFLHGLKNGMATEVIPILDEHFPELDINIELALYYFQYQDAKSLLESEKIYLKILSLTEYELEPYLNNLFLLFNHWLTTKNIHWIQVALKHLSFYVKKNYALAERILSEYAKVNMDAALIYSDLVIDMHRVSRIELAQSILKKFEHMYDRHILFNLYKLSVMSNSPKYRLLFNLAEMNHGEARNELFLRRKEHNSFELEYELLTALRDKNSLLAFNILNENCVNSNTQLELAIFAMQHQINAGESRIDQMYELTKTGESNVIDTLTQDLLLKFYDYLCQTTNDDSKIAFALTRLKSYLGNNDNAYNRLLFHARRHYSVVIDLIKFSLNTNDHTKLKQLKHVLELYHSEHLTTEGKYYLYLMEKIDNQLINLNLLSEIIKDKYELGINELIFLFNQFRVGKKYDCVLNDEKITLTQAISYFEGELASYALNVGTHQYESAEMMSLYYLKQNEFLKAERYIHICLELNLAETLNKLSIDLQQDRFSSAFKKFYLEKKRIFMGEDNINPHKILSNSIKSKIMLFNNDKTMTNRLEDEKFELRKIISKLSDTDERRFDLLEQMQKVRDYNDLSLIKSQLLEYVEPNKLRK